MVLAGTISAFSTEGRLAGVKTIGREADDDDVDICEDGETDDWARVNTVICESNIHANTEKHSRHTLQSVKEFGERCENAFESIMAQNACFRAKHVRKTTTFINYRAQNTKAVHTYLAHVSR